MDNEKMDIRWKQRFAHYKKAYALLEQTIAIAVEEKIRNAYFPALSQLFLDFNKKAET